MFERLLSRAVNLVNKIDDFDEDPRGWSRDISTFGNGQFSMASFRANEVMGDYLQVETGGRKAFFLGVYDGHYGADAASYVSTNMFPSLQLRIAEIQALNPEFGESIAPPSSIMQETVSEVEEGFMKEVKNGYKERPELAHVGTCCLFCYIWKDEIIYISNVGDSRAVLVSQDREVSTTDHNCNTNARLRDQLLKADSQGPRIVLHTRGAFRIGGISKITRSIGDAYLKHRPEFIAHDDFPMIRNVPEPYNQPVITTEAETFAISIKEDLRFLIVGTHGFWDCMTNEKAISTVKHNCRKGIAKRLIRKALKNAAKRGGIDYNILRNHDNRRRFHDDMSVIVIFFDHITTTANNNAAAEMLSYRGFTDAVVPSQFATPPLPPPPPPISCCVV